MEPQRFFFRRQLLANFSIGDLGSGYYPFGVLSDVRLNLSGRYEDGDAKLRWEVNQNTEAASYQLQRGIDGNEFETFSSIQTSNNNSPVASYDFIDHQLAKEKTSFYRIRQVLKNGNSIYSNVIRISDHNNRMELLGKPNPNPFMNQIELKLQLKSTSTTSIKLIDQSGRIVLHRNLIAQQGENNIVIGDGLSQLSPGIYIIEIRAGEEVIREKLVKE